MGLRKNVGIMKKLRGKGLIGRIVIKKLYTLGKTQEWLASEVGITKAYMSNILNGYQIPSARIIRKIADVLELNYDVLIEMILNSTEEEGKIKNVSGSH